MRFAYAKAGQYFKDFVLREDAAEEAVIKAVDKWWKDSSSTPLDEEKAKRVILNSLQYASRRRKLEPINVSREYDGFHGYKIK